MENNINIIKQSGEIDAFNKDKIFKSLSHTGADKEEIEKIIDLVQSKLYNGIGTKEIYKMVFNELKKSASHHASKYNLKNGILALGPTGFPFENFIGELLKYQGFKVKVGVTLQGHCVQHEVDVVAEKENKHFMIECKFHSSFKTKCNVRIPLYIQSRFLDVEKQWIKKEGHNKHNFHQGWVVNNTRFSEDAIQYANCVGIKLLSWDYPKNESLKDLISKFGLYPITCLNTLKKAEKQRLLNDQIVLCKHLCEDPSVLIKIGIKQNRINKILEDAHALCNSKL
jgi:hypothetical protein